MKTQSNKQFGKSKNAFGWNYFYYDMEKKIYHFSKRFLSGKYKGKYGEVIATEEDMQNGNIEFMLEHGLTNVNA